MIVSKNYHYIQELFITFMIIILLSPVSTGKVEGVSSSSSNISRNTVQDREMYVDDGFEAKRIIFLDETNFTYTGSSNQTRTFKIHFQDGPYKIFKLLLDIIIQGSIPDEVKYKAFLTGTESVLLKSGSLGSFSLNELNRHGFYLNVNPVNTSISTQELQINMTVITNGFFKQGSLKVLNTSRVIAVKRIHDIQEQSRVLLFPSSWDAKPSLFPRFVSSYLLINNTLHVPLKSMLNITLNNPSNRSVEVKIKVNEEVLNILTVNTNTILLLNTSKLQEENYPLITVEMIIEKGTEPVDVGIECILIPLEDTNDATTGERILDFEGFKIPDEIFSATMLLLLFGAPLILLRNNKEEQIEEI